MEGAEGRRRAGRAGARVRSQIAQSVIWPVPCFRPGRRRNAFGAGRQSVKTTAIIPVKRLDAAHAPARGCAGAQRIASDSPRRCSSTRSPSCRAAATSTSSLVVTADPSVERHARWLGHEVLEQPEDVGHSQAAIAGVEAAKERGAERVAMLPADCPLLDPDELDRHLGRTPRAALIVPDRHGTGTNALVLSPPDAFEPAFGPDSCSRHISRARAAGIGLRPRARSSPWRRTSTRPRT